MQTTRDTNNNELKALIEEKKVMDKKDNEQLKTSTRRSGVASGQGNNERTYDNTSNLERIQRYQEYCEHQTKKKEEEKQKRRNRVIEKRHCKHLRAFLQQSVL